MVAVIAHNSQLAQVRSGSATAYGACWLIQKYEPATRYMAGTIC